MHALFLLWYTPKGMCQAKVMPVRPGKLVSHPPPPPPPHCSSSYHLKISVLLLLLITSKLHNELLITCTHILMLRMLAISRHTVVCHAAKKPVHHTVSILTGKKKTTFSPVHSSMALSPKHTIFAL